MALTLHGTVSDNTVALDRKTATPLIINGDMQIAQRGTSATGLTNGSSGYHTCDRWELTEFGAPSFAFTQTQSTDVPTGQGFVNSLKMDCTTAQGSLAAADGLRIDQRVEGQNLQYLKKGTSSAEAVTISFWVKSNKTGTYIFEMFDQDNSRAISTAYTISSANTWEKKVIPIPGDTTGAFDNDNARSLDINWWLCSGTDKTSGTLQTSWVSNTNTNRAVGQVNIADSTSNDWYITGVQLEVGTLNSNSIPAFQHEDVATSLARCQRYFISHAVADGTRLGDGIFRSTTRAVGNVDCMGLVPNMRATPSVATTITGFAIYHGADVTTNSNASSGSGFAMSGTQECRTDFTFASGTTTAGLSGKLRANSAGAMQYEAEI